MCKSLDPSLISHPEVNLAPDDVSSGSNRTLGRLHVRSSHKLELKDIEEKKPKYLGKYNTNTGNENQANTIGKYNSNTGNENQTNTIELPNISTTENVENSEHKATSSTTVLFPSILRTLPYLKGPFDSA